MKAAKPKPLLAYAVQEEDEGTGGIVFARSGIAARRDGAAEFNGGEFGGLTCRRAPWADEFAPGPVPLIVMARNGWWHECPGCGARVGQGYDNEKRDRFDMVEVANGLYCRPTCRVRHLDREARNTIADAMEIHGLRHALWLHAPGVTLTEHSYVRHTVDFAKGEADGYAAAWVGFTFPGAISNTGRFGYDKPGEKPHVTVLASDKAAWDVWRESTKSIMAATWACLTCFAKFPMGMLRISGGVGEPIAGNDHGLNCPECRSMQIHPADDYPYGGEK